MFDIISYARKFSKFTFAEKQFNNIDGVIFSQLPYLNYKSLSGPTSLANMTIAEIAQFSHHTWNAKKNYQLLNIMKNSLRYRDVKFLDFTNKFSYGKEQNFSAVSMQINADHYFVGYRGTESNFVDWKEDMNLSFMKEIPSRVEATHYLKDFMNSVSGKVIIGGHSKGGDLATFAFKHIPESLQARITHAYSIDGPTSIKTKHTSIQDRITKLVPQTSLIGIIMDRSKKFQVVRSTADMMEQHNPFTWSVVDGDFEYLPQTDKFSKIVQDSLMTWQKELSPGMKKTFVNSLFRAIDKTGHTSVNEFAKHWKQNVIAITRTAASQPAETRKVWRNFSGKLIKCFITSTGKHAFR